jgi:hypothetical protein
MIELKCLRERVCHGGSRVSRDSGAARTITRSDPGCFCYWNGLGNAMSPVIEHCVRWLHKERTLSASFMPRGASLTKNPITADRNFAVIALLGCLSCYNRCN